MYKTLHMKREIQWASKKCLRGQRRERFKLHVVTIQVSIFNFLFLWLGLNISKSLDKNKLNLMNDLDVFHLPWTFTFQYIPVVSYLNRLIRRTMTAHNSIFYVWSRGNETTKVSPEMLSLLLFFSKIDVPGTLIFMMMMHKINKVPLKNWKITC